MADHLTPRGEAIRLDVAALLGLPPLKDVVAAVAKRQRLSVQSPATGKPEKRHIGPDGSFSLEIPRD